MSEPTDESAYDPTGARESRIRHLTSDMADMCRDLVDRYAELEALGASLSRIIDCVNAHALSSSTTITAVIEGVAKKTMMPTWLGPQGMPPIRPQPAISRVIDRLFAEADATRGAGLGADQAPALECYIVLRPGVTIQGSLSDTPEGTLRMLSPVEVNDPNGRPNAKKLVMAEQFFERSEVVAIAMQRDITSTTSNLVRS